MHSAPGPSPYSRLPAGVPSAGLGPTAARNPLVGPDLTGASQLRQLLLRSLVGPLVGSREGEDGDIRPEKDGGVTLISNLIPISGLLRLARYASPRGHCQRMPTVV